MVPVNRCDRAASDVVLQEAGAKALLVKLGDENMFALNATGTENRPRDCRRALRWTISVARFADTYAVAPVDVERDVRALLGELVERGLLMESDEPRFPIRRQSADGARRPLPASAAGTRASTRARCACTRARIRPEVPAFASVRSRSIARARAARLRRSPNPANPGVVLFDGYLFDARFNKTGARTRERCVRCSHRGGGVPALGNGHPRQARRVIPRRNLGIRVRRLILGHDALGHHPVFHAQSNGALWFTSNVLALRRRVSFRRRQTGYRWHWRHYCCGPPPEKPSSNTYGVCGPATICRPTPAAFEKFFDWSPWLDDDIRTD